MNLAVESATHYSPAQLSGLLNRAFSDYIIPIQLTPDDLTSMIVRDDVALDRSYVALDDGLAVGLALVAARATRQGTRLRLATMGVVPEGRRHGAARALLRSVIAAAREGGAVELVLEVFANNTPARALYEAEGFTARRRLLGFALHSSLLPTGVGDRVALRLTTAQETLALFEGCTADLPRKARPPWQLDTPALLRFGPPTAMLAIDEVATGATVGYVVLGQSRPDPHLIHLGILPAWRRHGLATAALAAIAAADAGVGTFYLPQLIPEGSPLVPFLRAVGAVPEAEEQLEMVLPLA